MGCSIRNRTDEDKPSEPLPLIRYVATVNGAPANPIKGILGGSSRLTNLIVLATKSKEIAERLLVDGSSEEIDFDEYTLATAGNDKTEALSLAPVPAV